MRSNQTRIAELRHGVAFIAYRVFSDAAAKGAFLLITLAAARRLPQADFGLFALGTTAGWIAAVVSDFGIQLHLARTVAARSADAELVLRKWLRVRMVTSAAALSAMALWLVLIRVRASVTLVVLLLGATYLLNGLVEFLNYLYRGLSRSDIESTLTLCQRLAMLVVGIAVLLWSASVAALAGGMLAVAIGTFWYTLRRARGLAAVASGPSVPRLPPDSRFPAQEFVQNVLPIGAGIVLSALYFRLDLFLLELWRGAAAVGLYNAVFRLVEALRLFPAAVLAVALPMLCRATGRGPLRQVAALVTLSGLAVAGALWITADRLIPALYGERYTDAVPIFRILIMAFPLMSLNCALTHQLVGWQRHWAYAAICGAALGFNVVTNLQWIPRLGATAAAWTTLGTEVVVSIGCLWALSTFSVGANPSRSGSIPVHDREPMVASERSLVI